MRRSARERRKFFDSRYVRDERRRSYRWAFMLFWSVLLYFFFHSYVVGVGILRERSMLPSMNDGDTYLVNKYLYRIRAPRRGEVVVLRTHTTAEDQYVKRVVAVPGDTLALRDGAVWLNGRPLPEPYALGPTLPQTSPESVPEDCFYVLGDNRMESVDSRRFGCVKLEGILGRIEPGKIFPFW